MADFTSVAGATKRVEDFVDAPSSILAYRRVPPCTWCKRRVRSSDEGWHASRVPSGTSAYLRVPLRIDRQFRWWICSAFHSLTTTAAAATLVRNLRETPASAIAPLRFLGEKAMDSVSGGFRVDFGSEG